MKSPTKPIHHKSPKKWYDPWDKAPIWIMHPQNSGIWLKAVTVSNTPPKFDQLEWEFVVRLDDNSTYVIRTIPTDVYNLEFQLVKHRCPDVDIMLNLTDMTSLAFLNEPEMVQCIFQRFSALKIYSNVGPILIAINPCQKLPIYSQEVLKTYIDDGQSSSFRATLPHVFQISDGAYRRIFDDRVIMDTDMRENQSILINGESGAGKTESTKQVLHYLAEVSSVVLDRLDMGSDAADVEGQVIASNPITESFGNAKTVRNNNSSRFGKFTELVYTQEGYIQGAIISTYLLETTRVVRQSASERNYHIFYEVFAGCSASDKLSWGLTSLSDFHYTAQSGELARDDGESDEENYRRLLDAMFTLELSEELQQEVMNIIVGILHLGNLEFEEVIISGVEAAVFSHGCSLHVDKVCKLLGFTRETLLVAVGRRCINIAGSKIQKTLNAESARSARDTLAKTAYDGLFKWLVAGINTVMASDVNDRSGPFIGVLDIFGFESFQTNSFEQLCINYTNEKLQDHFNYAVFKSEQEVYEEEGLQWTFVEYPDNSERLDLLENKFYGIFSLCDEQLKFPKASDEKLAQSYYDKCGKHKYFRASKADVAAAAFTIVHFAGAVSYRTTGFLDKNRGEVANEINECMAQSSNDLVHTMADHDAAGNHSLGGVRQLSSEFIRMNSSSESPFRVGSQGRPRSSSKNGRPRSGNHLTKKVSTVSAQFSKQLQSLMTKVRSTRSHFIRCVKPNQKLQPGVFDEVMVTQQLRCGGALGAVQVFRAGFPNRIDFESFVRRYQSFSFVTRPNPLQRDLRRLVSMATRTGTQNLWKLATSVLLGIIPFSEMLVQDLHKTSYGIDFNTARSGLQTGRTKVFLKAVVYDYLEMLRKRTVEIAASTLQRLHRARALAGRSTQRLSSPRSRWVVALAATTFMGRKRRVISRRLSATIVLQQFALVAIAVIRRRRVILGVTSLQSQYRGWKARALVFDIRNRATVRLQAWYRAQSLRRRYSLFLRAIVRLQVTSRAWLARSRKALVQRRALAGQRAVVRLQSLWRGQRARRSYREKIAKMDIDRRERLRQQSERREDLLLLLQSRLERNPHLLDALEEPGDTIAELRRQLTDLKQELATVKLENQTLRAEVKKRPTTAPVTIAPMVVDESQGTINDSVCSFFVSGLGTPVTPIMVSRESLKLRNTVLRLERENDELRTENENVIKNLMNSSLSMSMSFAHLSGPDNRAVTAEDDLMRDTMQGDVGRSPLGRTSTPLDCNRSFASRVISPADVESFSKARTAADEKVHNLREFIKQLRSECRDLRAKIPIKPATSPRGDVSTPLSKSALAATASRHLYRGSPVAISRVRETPSNVPSSNAVR